MCRSRQPPNFWRRCHLLVFLRVLLETNLGIFTEGNFLLCYIQPSTWGNQRGEFIHSTSRKLLAPLPGIQVLELCPRGNNKLYYYNSRFIINVYMSVL